MDLFREGVQDTDTIPGHDQGLDQMTTNESSTPGDQDVHMSSQRATNAVIAVP